MDELYQIALKKSKGKILNDEEQLMVKEMVKETLKPINITTQFDHFIFTNEKLKKSYLQNLPAPHCCRFLTDSYYICSCTEKILFICESCNERMGMDNHYNHTKGKGNINMICQCGIEHKLKVSETPTLLTGSSPVLILPTHDESITNKSTKIEKDSTILLVGEDSVEINKSQIISTENKKKKKGSGFNTLEQRIEKDEQKLKTLHRSQQKKEGIQILFSKENAKEKLESFKAFKEKIGEEEKRNKNEFKERKQKLKDLLPSKYSKEIKELPTQSNKGYCCMHGIDNNFGIKITEEMEYKINNFIIEIMDCLIENNMNECYPLLEYINSLMEIPIINESITIFVTTTPIMFKNGLLQRFFSYFSSGTNVISFFCDKYCEMIIKNEEETEHLLYQFLIELGPVILNSFTNSIIISLLPPGIKYELLTKIRKGVIGYEDSLNSFQINTIVVKGVLEIFKLRRNQITVLLNSKESITQYYSIIFNSITNVYKALEECFEYSNMYFLCEVIMNNSEIFGTFVELLYSCSYSINFNTMNPFSYIIQLRLKLFEVLRYIFKSLTCYLNLFRIYIKHYRIIKTYVDLVLKKHLQTDTLEFDGGIILFRLYSLIIRMLFIQKSSKSITYKLLSGYFKLQHYSLGDFTQRRLINLNNNDINDFEEQTPMHIDIRWLFTDSYFQKTTLLDSEKKKLSKTSLIFAQGILHSYLSMLKSIKNWDQFFLKQKKQKIFLPIQYLLIYSFDPLFGKSLDTFFLQLVYSQYNFIQDMDLIQKQNIHQLFGLDYEMMLIFNMINENNYEPLNDPTIKYLTCIVMIYIDISYVRYNIVNEQDVSILQQLNPSLNNYCWFQNGSVVFNMNASLPIIKLSPTVFNQIPYFNRYIPMIYQEDYHRIWVQLFNESYKGFKDPYSILSSPLIKFPYIIDSTKNLIFSLIAKIDTEWIINIESTKELLLFIRIQWIFIHLCNCKNPYEPNKILLLLTIIEKIINFQSNLLNSKNISIHLSDSMEINQQKIFDLRCLNENKLINVYIIESLLNIFQYLKESISSINS
ncbi:hypothetical protein KM1_008090 [Entamoeba histolytica HM-3:IMSS]|uniref:Uncharacterized protein n=6 Tax=Entamoeba histolytica TaxID=5759 RepID=C4M0Y6_ENTH1|nr:hypothetical protein EHI_134990 [Entamoeba histolytica HM-1:IMSS]EMD48597.1 Hypothetical protein EHI5A_009520 [Entamoeba histolytica KU27]EMS14489.1 hypothetical protein KM1_008090 [Entamoeba histolytica HM-3:IMSS]ENY60592.1 hypothetical protein EHI7A_048020 [Entamoeba histolytica HM-1:IMSS-A]GAT94843.1 hypothetical protein CL6EHI_134990 [Entamoeba histolytica]EAL46280.1 hypothetical protein EHI_134990 [Entamoeba histolytica HM-1:IMSS]|eukprot:XP_651667.1 hypothetical protein EHI_134990 [Entamoeba histolytica HM-1:IMSS]